MQKLVKKLSLVMVALMTVFTALSYMPAKAATVVPKVQFVGDQKLEYTAGERITFNLNASNYGGRVQYRVVLWDDNTKSMKDLWNTADRYYANWMPYGNETLPLGWVINEPGSYRITVYAKRAGLANSKTALTGANCDSYVAGPAFVVKPAAVTPVAVTSVAPVADVTVDEMAKPVLPTEVTLNLADNTTKVAKVTWAAVDTTKAGTYPVEGTVEGTELKAKVNVIVKAVALEVKSVTATNLKEVVVTFNKPVDEDLAEDVNNYVVKQGSNTKGVDSAELNDDGMTVVLTMAVNDTLGNQSSCSVKISNVKDLAGNKIAAVTKSFTAVDVTIPTVVSVEVAGPKVLEVTFSEPIKAAGNVGTVKFDDGSIYAGVSVDGSNVVKVSLGLAPAEGEHKLNVKNFGDYSGLKNVSVDNTFTYAKNTSAPVATISKINENEVTFEFDKKVDMKSAYGTDIKVYHTINNQSAYKASSLVAVNDTDADGYATKWKATFATPMRSGNVEIFMYAKANKFEDLWGNDVAVNTSYNATVVTDLVAPTATVEAVSDKKIEVTFDEDVVSTDARVKANYTFYDADGKLMTSDDYDFVDGKGHPTSGATITYSSVNDEYVATITLDSAMDPGSYSLEISGIEDKAYVANEMEDFKADFKVTDSTNPTISKVLVNSDRDTILVYFSEAMDTAGLDDLGNYAYKVDGGAVTSFDLDNDSIEIISPKIVQITLDTPITNFGVGAADYVVVNGRLADLEDNEIGGLTVTTVVTPDSVAGYVANSAKLTDVDAVQFQVNSLLSAIDLNEITVAGNTVVGASYVNGATKATVYLTLGTDVASDVSDLGTITVDAAALTTEYGTDNTQFTITKANVLDKVAPTLDAVELTSGTTVKLTFSEALDPNTVSALTFSVAGNDVVSYTLTDSAAPAHTGDILTLTLDNAEATDATLTVKQELAVKDLDGNTLAAGESTDSDDVAQAVATISDTTDANNNTDKLVLTLSEALYDNTGDAIADQTDLKTSFTVTGTATITSAVYDEATQTITLVVAGAVNGDAIAFNFDQYEDANDNASTDVTYVYASTGTVWSVQP